MDLDHVVGPDGEEEAIERGVMELAQRDAVADQRLALGVAVRRDVHRVQELQMAQPAEGAALGVRAGTRLTGRPSRLARECGERGCDPAKFRRVSPSERGQGGAIGRVGAKAILCGPVGNAYPASCRILGKTALDELTAVDE